MGLFAQMFDGLVAPSSPVEGLGTLQYGIRAKVAAWAWMGHERSVSRGRFPTAQKKLGENGWMPGKFTNFSKCQNCQLIKKLSGKFFRCSGSLSWKVLRCSGMRSLNLTRWKPVRRKLWKDLCVRRPSAENNGSRSCSCGGD